MKLSEAMRKGIAVTDPIVAELYTEAFDPPRACALGAASLGVGCPRLGYYIDTKDAIYAKCGLDVEVARVQHPITNYMDILEDVIFDLNDIREWTREQIADWLESIGY